MNLPGLLKNKPSLIIYQMQIDGQKALAYFYEISNEKIGIKGFRNMKAWFRNMKAWFRNMKAWFRNVKAWLWILLTKTTQITYDQCVLLFIFPLF